MARDRGALSPSRRWGRAVRRRGWRERGFGGGAGPSAALDLKLVRGASVRSTITLCRVVLMTCGAGVEWRMSIESPRELIGKRGPRSLTIGGRSVGRRLHHRTGAQLLVTARKVGGEAGGGRVRHDRHKKQAGQRVSWAAIPDCALSAAPTVSSLYSGADSDASRVLCQKRVDPQHIWTVTGHVPPLRPGV